MYAVDVLVKLMNKEPVADKAAMFVPRLVERKRKNRDATRRQFESAACSEYGRPRYF